MESSRISWIVTLLLTVVNAHLMDSMYGKDDFGYRVNPEKGEVSPERSPKWYDPNSENPISSRLLLMNRRADSKTRWSRSTTDSKIYRYNWEEIRNNQDKSRVSFSVSVTSVDQRSRRSAPGSERIGSSPAKAKTSTSTTQWSDSSQNIPTEGPVTREPRSTKDAGRETSLGSARATKQPEDVYTPFPGQRFDTFDWRLCREMDRLTNDNAAVSPVGVKLVLGLLHEAAARGALSARELTRALDMPEGRSAARNAFRHIMRTLQENQEGHTMKVGNRIYIDQSITPLQNITKIFSSYYNAPIKIVNFANPLAVKQSINSWVSNFTNGQISNLLTKAHQLNRVVSMILNVIYFKGEWLYPFTQTRVGQFHVTPNKTINVNYMYLTGDLYYSQSEELDAQMLRLPYKGNKYSMFLILPNKKENFNQLIQNINPTNVRAMLQELAVADVRAKIPKFKFDYSIQLKEVLQKLGIRKIFTPSDEINLVTMKKNIGISKIIQKVGFEVNEEGTEASSATDIEIANYWGGGKPFSATHPFIFFIEEEKTGTVVFIGKVVNPTHNTTELLLLPAGERKMVRSVLE